MENPRRVLKGALASAHQEKEATEKRRESYLGEIKGKTDVSRGRDRPSVTCICVYIISFWRMSQS